MLNSSKPDFSREKVGAEAARREAIRQLRNPT